jgi:2-keto-3-deoxy-6-phosphogluconate aldolase
MALQRLETLEKIVTSGVVAVVRAESAEQACRIADALARNFVKAVKGPLPHASLMPTGGVTPENVVEWIHAGCAAVGVGGSLTTSAKRGDFEAITAQAQQFVAKVREARASHK